MKPDLLGYLMNAVEPDEARQIEELLDTRPELRKEMIKQRALLAPLDLLENTEPSADLIYKTLRGVATARSLEMPVVVSVSKPEAVKTLTPISAIEPWKISEYEAAPTNWRRADAWALIAVVLLICLGIPPVLQFVRDRALQTECKDNMRQVYSALDHYMRDHNNSIPALSETGPTSHAGSYAVALRDKGLWGDSLRLSCPPGGPKTPPTLEEIKQHKEEEQAYWQNFAGSYAYHLGYVTKENGKDIVQALKRGDGDSLPILADRAPRFGEVTDWATANSPNHGGRGQNVLHLGGHVQFVPFRSAAGGEDNDIFRNQNNQQHAGLRIKDIVLGSSEARPLPSYVPMD
jgi:type II secretory pathway pseudopilin PulG